LIDFVGGLRHIIVFLSSTFSTVPKTNIMAKQSLVQTWLAAIGLAPHILKTVEAAGIVNPEDLAELEICYYPALGVQHPGDRKKLFYLVQKIKTAVESNANNNDETSEDAAVNVPVIGVNALVDGGGSSNKSSINNHDRKKIVNGSGSNETLGDREETAALNHGGVELPSTLPASGGRASADEGFFEVDDDNDPAPENIPVPGERLPKKGEKKRKLGLDLDDSENEDGSPAKRAKERTRETNMLFLTHNKVTAEPHAKKFVPGKGWDLSCKQPHQQHKCSMKGCKKKVRIYCSCSIGYWLCEAHLRIHQLECMMKEKCCNCCKCREAQSK